ncbi:MAG: hypothetical protein Q7W16_05960 [Coriobacteriia bacterium]|nr:hypothetical protein [Coriobacteriia bacterium]
MRSDLKRLILATVGVLAVVVTLVALLNQGLDATGCTAAAPLGWIIPLVSSAVIAGLAWLLLSQVPLGSAGSEDHTSVDCASCGRNVLTDWRLCPYCGVALSPGPATRSEPLVD